MPNRKWQGSSSTYRFDFNGKEKDPETELNDFGARFYAANIGRWLSIDPLAAKFPNWSPYNAMNDNPIFFIDPDGQIPVPLKGTYVIPKNESVYLQNQRVWVKRSQSWITQTGYFEGGRTKVFKNYEANPSAQPDAIIRTSNWDVLRHSTPNRAMTSPHIGSDYRAAVGTDVYSYGDGIVTKIDAKNGNLTVRYGNYDVTFRHLSKIEPMKLGDKIYEGQIVAQSGITNTTQAHLHVDAFDIQTNKSVDPETINVGTVSNQDFFTTYKGDYLLLKQVKEKNQVGTSPNGTNIFKSPVSTIDTSDDLVPDRIKQIKRQNDEKN